MAVRRPPGPSRVLLAAGLAVLLPACGARTASRTAAPPNLLLVTLDTVRADRVGAYGATGASTPNLDRLAREGVRLAAAVSPAPLTLPAHASLLTGLLPDRHGLASNGVGRLPEGLPTLATHLTAAGYRTGAFVGAFVLDRRFGLDRGFSQYDDDIPRGVAGVPALEAERPASVVADRALAWLRSDTGRPFFAWVHFYDAHAPYEPPEPYRGRFPGRPYDGEVAAVDDQLGRLLADLERLGLAERTVVAVVGDHGEALGEHGELTHGLLLYEGTLRVPAVLRAPGVLPEGFVVATAVGLVDLAPTLAGLLGRPLSAAEAASDLDGRDISGDLSARREPGMTDLLSEARYPTVFGWSALSSVRRGDLKYTGGPEPELYDLGRDPGENDNLASRRGPAAAELAAVLAGRRAQHDRNGWSTGPDAEARAMLARLGYVAPAGGAGASHGCGGPDPRRMVGLFRRFEEAHWALLEGRVDDARRTLEALVQEDPPNAVFRSQLAEACRRSGDLGRALELHRQAVALAPEDPETLYNLATVLQEAGRAAEAVVVLEAVLRVDPGRPEALNALAIALSLGGDLERARESLLEVTARDPRNAPAFNNLGNVLREMGRPDEAEAAFRRAIELDAAYPDPLNGLGALEVNRNRPLAALPLFDRALELAPDRHEVRLNRGIALEVAGDRAGAGAAYRDFITRARGDPRFGAQCEAARGLLERLENNRPNG